MAPAIKYTGSYQDLSGYASANRAFITALYLAGVDITTELAVHMKERAHTGWEGDLCYNLQGRNIPYRIKIIHLTPDMYENYIEPDIYTIGHLFWETDRLPKEWADHCNKLREIWVSSDHMIALFKKSGVRVPMYAFPQPIDVTMAEKEYRKYLIDQHKGLMFYSIFQWIERKNPQLLLKAYWEAFKGYDDVTLLLKTFRLSYDEAEFNKIRDDILEWKQGMGQGQWPKVLLSTQVMDQEQIMRLHATGDVFVLPHRGEGWNRCIAEAMLMGKPVIATARGGIHEYLSQEHYFPINSSYVNVTEVPYIKFYTKDQMWAEADKAHLIKQMQFVYNNYQVSTSKSLLAKEFVKDRFNYFRVGQMMRERLEKIYQSL